MNNQDQVPTIAELWKKLQIANTPSSWKGFGKRPSRSDREFVSEFKENELQSIRQQLLERCKILYGMQPIWSGEYWFVNPPRTAALGLKSHELKSMGSALLFMDWELEQREKEASGD